MKMQYGDACLSLQQVYDWDKKFKNGVSSVADAVRSGQTHTADTPEMVAGVVRVLRENCRITLDEVVFELNTSRGSADHIIHNVLGFRKVSARWVPRQLTPELKDRRVDACEEILQRYETEGDAFLQRVVTGDESWVHYFQPETKRASKEWRHLTSPKPQKFRTHSSAGKVMLFWDSRGPLVEHYMPRETTVTSASY